MNRYCWIFTCLTIALPAGFSFGDQPGTAKRYAKLYRLAEKLYRDENPTGHKDSLALASYLRVITLLKDQHINDSVLWDSYYKAAIYHQTFGDYDKALPLLKRCLSFATTSVTLPETAFYLPNIYTGNSYYMLNRFDSARFYYRRAEGIAARHPGVEGLERLYNTLGVINYETGNYIQSSYYFEKALSTLAAKANGDSSLLVTYKNNLASVYSKQQRYDEAMNIYRNLLHYNINKDELRHNIGTIYLNKGDSRRAISFIRSVSYNDQNKMNDLGLAYLNLGRYDSAQFFFEQAFRLNEKKNGKRKNISQGLSFKLNGDLLASQRRWKEALVDYQGALMQMVYLFNNPDIYHNPGKFEGILSFRELFEALVAKAGAFEALYDTSKNTRDLEAAVSTYQSAYRLADYIEKSYETDEARLFLNKTKYRSHGKPIDVCMRLFALTGRRLFLEQAFYFDEKNKASALSINLQESRLRAISGIPAELLEKENDLKQSITRLSLKASEPQETNTVDIQALIRDQSLQLTALQDRFDEYPDYRRLKYADNTISVPALQKIIPEKAAVLSYHIGDHSLVAFLVAGNHFQAFSFALQDSLLPAIRAMNKIVQLTDESNQQAIISQSQYIYRQLLKPFESILEGYEQLIIIPDDELSLVNFEMLMNNERELLLKKFAISYNYSCSLLQSGHDRNDPVRYLLFAMAPFTESTGKPAHDRDDEVALLPASRSEVIGLNGKILLGKAATRTAFLQQSPGYSIIHLATHARANDEDPMKSFISFYPLQPDSAFTYKLYIPEIYHLDLKGTALVILSACETGEGQLIKGEGIMSLSRAFSYAGCPKIITSLWKADDQATSFIANRLHHYLRKKFSVVRALQQAKLDYLDDDRIAARVKTPSYWAHLRLIGDLEETPGTSRWYYLVILLFVVLMVLLARKIRSRMVTGSI